MRFLKIAVCILGSVALLGGCSQKKSTSSFLGMDDVSLFSDRPQNVTDVALLIELKVPPAAESIKAEDSKKSIPPEALEAINQEQDKFIEKLKKLSPESRVLFRYKMILNAVAVVVPAKITEQVTTLVAVEGRGIQKASYFNRPQPLVEKNDLGLALEKAVGFPRSSVKFIGADKIYGLSTTGADGNTVSINGTGMKIGIIDTGIDYTHAMFGGEGTVEAFKAVNPSATSSLFPNKKVIGGIDLVGTHYNAAARLSKDWIPTPDDNPIDEAGHGTHVAGTVAGIGDEVNTYSGVAPGAGLYAIKVFGAEGSTSDFVVIAGLEYAMDPNKDGNLDDQLDVVNLSLGGGYGLPKIMYEKAIANLSRAGTVAVISAGNSGDEPYIVGAPGTSEAALSVAASVDDTEHNWNFNAVRFKVGNEDPILSEAVEGTITLPISEAGEVKGPLYYIGLANAELSNEVKAELKGKVALIDRGQVSFSEKIKRAYEGGAIGVVVINNQVTAPINMGGGTEKFPIPGIMIAKSLGDKFKSVMPATVVSIEFKTSEKFQKPELIDTLTGFSSTGPRSVDGLFKPEIAAPGSQIISAAMGGGAAGVKLSGTSMAAPHMAGVMALMKQAHKDLTVKELKSLVMSTAKTAVDANKVTYKMSKQGAGRVQAFKAVQSEIVADQVAVSLGIVGIQSSKVMKQNVTLKNIGKNNLNLVAATNSTPGLTIKGPKSIELNPGSSVSIELRMTLTAPVTNRVEELNGLWTLNDSNGNEVFRLPVLAIARKMSAAKAISLKVAATNEDESTGSVVDLELTNTSIHSARVFPMNLLGVDDRKASNTTNQYLNRDCDLQSAGYRVVTRTVDGNSKTVLQVGAKLYNPLTTWDVCQLIVLIDSNNDQVPEQELAILPLESVAGLASPTNGKEFFSVLLDAAKVRGLRAEYEASQVPDVKENYLPATLDVLSAASDFSNSTITIAEADLSQLAKRPTGELAIKVVAQLASYDAIENDDFLNSKVEWQKISVTPQSHAYFDMPSMIELKGGETQTLSFNHGEGRGDLLLLMPDNRSTTSDLLTDDQMQLVKPAFTLN